MNERKITGLVIIITIIKFVHKDYQNPSIITDNEQWPDFTIANKGDNVLLEPTVSFKTNIKKNFDCRAKRYQQLLAELSKKQKVYYVNLSLVAIGMVGNGSLIMTAMKNFDLSKETLNFIVNRTINIHMSNKEWENPQLLNW